MECFVEAEQNATNKLMRAATKKWDTTRPFSSNTAAYTPQNVRIYTSLFGLLGSLNQPNYLSCYTRHVSILLYIYIYSYRTYAHIHIYTYIHTQDANATVRNAIAYLDVNGFSHGALLNPASIESAERWPERAVISSECCSCESQRGELFPNVSAGKTMLPVFQKFTKQFAKKNHSPFFSFLNYSSFSLSLSVDVHT